MHHAPWNRDRLPRPENRRLAAFDLDLELAVEDEKALVVAFVLVPVKLAVQHTEPDDGVVDARQRLVEPRLVPCREGVDVELAKLPELVVEMDVVLDHPRNYVWTSAACAP